MGKESKEAGRSKKRVGVFLCHCGKNVAGGLDIELLEKKVRAMDGVAWVERNMFFCSQEGQDVVQGAIEEHDLHRFVVAACAPSLHLATFQRCAEKVGVDPAFADLVDIRKWTMAGSPERVDPEEALRRAESLIRRTVKRIRLKRIPPKVEVEVEPAVLVIGGGIAGVEAALDLAEKGYRVSLVERLPTIGGKMALLYKVFPTNDCAPCILAPKVAYAGQHPRITLLTNSEVETVTGHIGDFRVTVRRNPRYVSLDRCTGCKVCIDKCPARAPDEYAAGLGTRRAISIPFPQAIPHKAVIDADHCLFFQKGVCRACEAVCPFDAIRFDEEPEKLELKVGAIVVATGFDEYDPTPIHEYGYSRYTDIITQLQLARLLDIDGPTGGKLIRPSDGKEPERIVMIQCVGSRDERTNPYCSSVCCMYALKHAQIIKEMVLPRAEIYVCYTDMRTPGKGFEAYYRRSRELGVVFLRGKPGEIREDPSGEQLRLDLEDTDLDALISLEADLVVLSCAMVPSRGTLELARILGIGTDESGFFRETHPKLRPVETEIRGIYICGCAQGPKDIPDAIVQAKAAASCADTELRKGRILLPASLVAAARAKEATPI
jgi:heterodisulfide reductase subunit A